MRCMVRNKLKFYSSEYMGKEDVLDNNGRKTGEKKLLYSNPIKHFGNISAAQGEVQSRQFGESESYDKVIVLDDRNVSINEHSILWVDTLPSLNDDGTTDTPHDYIVKKVARSINGVSIAVRKVDVDG